MLPNTYHGYHSNNNNNNNNMYSQSGAKTVPQHYSTANGFATVQNGSGSASSPRSNGIPTAMMYRPMVRTPSANGSINFDQTRSPMQASSPRASPISNPMQPYSSPNLRQVFPQTLTPWHQNVQQAIQQRTWPPNMLNGIQQQPWPQHLPQMTQQLPWLQNLQRAVQPPSWQRNVPQIGANSSWTQHTPQSQASVHHYQGAPASGDRSGRQQPCAMSRDFGGNYWTNPGSESMVSRPEVSHTRIAVPQTGGKTTRKTPVARPTIPSEQPKRKKQKVEKSKGAENEPRVVQNDVPQKEQVEKKKRVYKKRNVEKKGKGEEKEQVEKKDQIEEDQQVEEKSNANKKPRVIRQKDQPKDKKLRKAANTTRTKPIPKRTMNKYGFLVAQQNPISELPVASQQNQISHQSIVPHHNPLSLAREFSKISESAKRDALENEKSSAHPQSQPASNNPVSSQHQPDINEDPFSQDQPVPSIEPQDLPSKRSYRKRRHVVLEDDEEDEYRPLGNSAASSLAPPEAPSSDKQPIKSRQLRRARQASSRFEGSAPPAPLTSPPPPASPPPTAPLTTLGMNSFKYIVPEKLVGTARALGTDWSRYVTLMEEVVNGKISEGIFHKTENTLFQVENPKLRVGIRRMTRKMVEGQQSATSSGT